MSTRRTRYAVAGASLGFGAPAGLLLLRLAAAGFSADAVVDELAGYPDVYLYTVISTVLVFAIFGGVLGGYADRLENMATTDPLTGLLNVRAFDDRFRQEISRSERYQEPLSLLIIDVDDLKNINDRHGHEAGDLALKAVAWVIRSGIRDIDLGARLGGDEFAVVAPRADLQAAAVLAERLRSLAALRDAPHSGRPNTISVGVAVLMPSDPDLAGGHSLRRRADDALYAAKRAGGNRVVVAPPTSETRSRLNAAS